MGGLWSFIGVRCPQPHWRHRNWATNTKCKWEIMESTWINNSSLWHQFIKFILHPMFFFGMGSSNILRMWCPDLPKTIHVWELSTMVTRGIPSEYPFFCHENQVGVGKFWSDDPPLGTFHTWYSRCCTWCCHVWEHACGIIWKLASCNCQLFQLQMKRLAVSSQTPIFVKRVNHSPRSSSDTNRSSKACETYRVPCLGPPKGAMISSGSHGATKDDWSRKPGVAPFAGRPLSRPSMMMPWGGAMGGSIHVWKYWKWREYHGEKNGDITWIHLGIIIDNYILYDYLDIFDHFDHVATSQLNDGFWW